ncbi:MAG TPA: hypothetical protein VHO24_11690 [Opitutaceae bacterium]|nr:hypothetical protein [Opitutaceae bacterium]
MRARLQKLSAAGRCFFGLAMIASGAMQLFLREFVRLVPKQPAGAPWPIITGVILVVAGGLIVAGKRQRAGAGAVAALLLVALALRVPGIVANPGAGFVWTNPCKTLALFGAALLLAGVGLGPIPPVRLCRWLLAVFLVVGGVQHFVYAGFVHKLVPAWMPWVPFWTYFTGVALCAAGIGLVLPRTASLAAASAGLMIFLWVLLLHLPRALIHPGGADEMAGVFEALALSGVAFLAVGGPVAFSSHPILKNENH